MNIKKLMSAAVITVMTVFSAVGSNPLVPTEKGVKLEYGSYDKKGKVTGYTIQTVKDITEKNGETHIDMAIEALDENKKPIKDAPEMTLTYIISKGSVILDMEAMFKTMIPQQAGMDVKIMVEGSSISYPAIMSVGASLPDTDLAVSMEMMGRTMKVTDIKNYNRKVEARESVTVEAGTFDAYKVTETTETKAMVGGAQINVSTSWFVDGIGKVKSDEYDNKGNLQSSMRLISITK